jgi:hypothetical protein
MAEALEAWDAKAIKSAADHPQSHGIIERYNRQVINDVAKLLKQSKQAEWTAMIAAACEHTTSYPTKVWLLRIDLIIGQRLLFSDRNLY